MMRVKILVATQKPVFVPHDDIFQLIQVGCKGKPSISEGILRDDTGDNISDKNKSFCELTAQYWAWKNLDLDYYGFCHYRRYLTFNDDNAKYSLDNGNVLYDVFDKHAVEKFHMDRKFIEESLQNADVIISKKLDVRNLSKGYKNVRDHYEKAPFLKKQDLDLMMEIIHEKEPAYEKCANDVLDGQSSYFCNMYIMQKKLFFSYCDWLFPLLFEFEKRNTMEHYDYQAYRTPGHLAERLVTVYLQYQKEKDPSLRIVEKQQILFHDTSSALEIKPAFPEHNIPVVMNLNDKFVPQLSVVIASVLENSNPSDNYDLLILDTDITEQNKMILRSMLQGHENFSIRFLSVTPYLNSWHLRKEAHVPAISYYRLLIPVLLHNYDKILYIDCDLVVCHDISELYQTEIGVNYLAGVKDIDFQGQINREHFGTKEYAKDTLHLDDPYSYVQAGVLLFNIKKILEDGKEKEFLKKAELGYHYMDQDVLNSSCQGKIAFLDQRWNVINDCNHERIKDIISYTPHKLYSEYMDARKKPYIVHYAGFEKPWHNAEDDFAKVFWSYARNTPFYETILQTMLKSKTKPGKSKKRILIDYLFPKGTKRREFAAKFARKCHV